ncbi:hypothetical protein OG783_28980 [Streptomyces jietaisiensis]|uniref:hypothetical protein n=1 Tax=Streptomyces griseoaurantiacus TaxID=68213 RepID=UPI0032561238
MKLSLALASSSPAARKIRRRVLLGALLLAILLAVSGALAYLTRPQHPTAGAAASAPTTSSPGTKSPKPSPGASGPDAMAPPSSAREPLAYAKAAAVTLWSYDTRSRSQPEHVALLHRWLSRQTDIVDTDSVDNQVPSPTLWGRMADSGQYATATASDARFPDAFTDALRENPGRLTETYVYAVTVTGKQSIAWNNSPKGGAESRTVTLAVQCRPHHACALVGVLPAVAQ